MKKKTRALTLPDFKNTIVKTAWYWCEDGQIGQGDRTETPKINPSIYRQLILDEVANAIQWRSLSIGWGWNNWLFRYKKVWATLSTIYKTDLFKINWWRSIDLNAKSENHKTFRRNYFWPWVRQRFLKCEIKKHNS